MTTPLIELTPAGPYCAAGDFHIDPWHAVDRAVVTHGHADHARWGSRQYLAAADGLSVFRARLGDTADIRPLAYGERISLNGVTVSLHPAGHILGSAQVRVEHRGEVWVVSGDYKTDPDPTCAAFEPVPCHTFVTESTFGLPVYRWPPQSAIFDQVNQWWRANADAGRASLLYAYALGKSQRLLAGLDPAIGPIYGHGAVEKLNDAYRAGGVPLPPTSYAAAEKGTDWTRAMILAPPSCHGSAWTKKFGPHSSAVASGWMTIRGPRRRKAVDRGFVLSDHADWPGLLSAIRSTGSTRVLATHGYSAALVRWLREQGLDADSWETRYAGEAGDDAGPAGEYADPQTPDAPRGDDDRTV